MLSGLLMATPAHAASVAVISPDGGAYGRVQVGASENYTLVANNKKCDGRGAVLHYNVSGIWYTHSDSSCHGGQVVRGPFAGRGSQIDLYVCTTNTRTGYKSCSSTKRLYV